MSSSSNAENREYTFCPGYAFEITDKNDDRRKQMHDIYLGEFENYHLFACVVDEKYHDDPEYRGERYGRTDTSCIPTIRRNLPSISCSPTNFVRSKMGWAGNVKDKVKNPRILSLFDDSKDQTRKYILKKRPVAAGHHEKYLDTKELEERFLDSRAADTASKARQVESGPYPSPFKAVIQENAEVLASFLLFLEIEFEIKMDPEAASLFDADELKELTPEKKEKYLERMMREEEGKRTFVEKYIKMMGDEDIITAYQKTQILNQASNLQWHDDEQAYHKGKKGKEGLLAKLFWCVY